MVPSVADVVLVSPQILTEGGPVAFSRWTHQGPVTGQEDHHGKH